MLAHGEKLGQSPFHAWAVMPSRWTHVTDATAKPDQLRRFRERGVEVVVAPAAEAAGAD